MTTLEELPLTPTTTSSSERNSIAASTPTLDGARMSRTNTPYSWSQSVVVNIDPANYRVLTAVRAYNSC